MNCFWSSILGIGLVGAGFYTSLVPKEEVNKLKNMVSGEASEAYEKISKERSTIYTSGLLFGALFTLIFNNIIKLNFTNTFHKITFNVLVILVFANLYYHFTPKSDFMLNYLKTPEENKAWLQVYNTMKSRYIKGFLISSIAVIPLANSICL